ncbi:hypothetical protein GCM10009079_41300 [Ralstonia mannitolilytica]
MNPHLLDRLWRRRQKWFPLLAVLGPGIFRFLGLKRWRSPTSTCKVQTAASGGAPRHCWSEPGAMRATAHYLVFDLP